MVRRTWAAETEIGGCETLVDYGVTLVLDGSDERLCNIVGFASGRRGYSLDLRMTLYAMFVMLRWVTIRIEISHLG